MQARCDRRKTQQDKMGSVHVYLPVFLLMVMIGKVKPGGVISLELCSGKDLKMEMKHAAVVVEVFYNDKRIAKSSDVSSMKWDKNLQGNYEDRLSFTNPITVTLTNVLYEDTGIYRIVTKSSKGIARFEDWNITVLVPPIVEENAEKFSITEKRVNDSCSRLTCGSFLSLGKPEVNFKWNGSNSMEQTVTVCGLQKCNCFVVGPAAECLTTNLSAGYRCADHPPKSGKLLGGIIAAIALVVLCCVVALMIYKWRRKTRKKQMINARVAETEENTGLAEGLPDTNV